MIFSIYLFQQIYLLENTDSERMKSDNRPELQSQALLQAQTQKISIKCSQTQDSKSACSSKNCQAYAFTCSNHSCQCIKQHEFCLMTLTSTIFKNLSSKIISAQSFKKQIDDKFNKMIDKISDFRDKLLQDISVSFELNGLNEIQKNVYQSIKFGRTEEIKGKDIWQACYYQSQLETENLFDNLIKKVNETFSSHFKVTQTFLSLIQKQVKDYSQSKWDYIHFKQGLDKSDNNKNQANNRQVNQRKSERRQLQLSLQNSYSDIDFF